MDFNRTLLIPISLIWLLFAGVALWNLSLRPTAGIEFMESDSTLFYIDQSGDSIAFWETNNVPVHKRYEVRYLIDRSSIGDTLTIKSTDDSIIRMPLTARYDRWALILKGFVGLCFFLISTIILYNRPQEGERYFALSGYLFGFTIMTWSSEMHLAPWLSLPLIIVYFLTYPQAVISFVYFSYYFPRQTLSPSKLKRRKAILHFIGLAFSFFLLVLYFTRQFTPSRETMAAYFDFYRIFRLIVISLFAFAVYNMYRNESKGSNPVSQRKLHWVFGGLFWGIFPFIFLWNVPRMLSLPAPLPEWSLDIFFVMAPAAIAISILRFRLFNIEILLSRSLVYGFVVTILLAVYVAVVGGLSIAINQNFALDSPYFSALAAVIIAFLMNPVRKVVGRFVDQKFFRIRYHRFQRMQDYLKLLEQVSSEAQLFNMLQANFNESVPLKDQFFIAREDGEFRLLNITGNTVERVVNPELEKLRIVDGDTIAINTLFEKKVEKSDQYQDILIDIPTVLVVPIGSDFLWGLGLKASGSRFWVEDVDLAKQMARAAALQAERLNYFQIAIRESLEKEQAQQLSNWKTMLIAEVAHDLRAPLNTILWKLKNLQSEIASDGPADPESIEGVRKQIHRLQGFIQNMLVLSKMESGQLDIKQQPVDVQAEVDTILQDLQSIIEQKRLKVSSKIESNLRLAGDPIIFQEILLNLLDNATKFSRKNGKILIAGQHYTNGSLERVEIGITDEAGGIDENVLKALFEPFKDDGSEKEGKGFHLGLYIANKFTDILKGEFVIDTTPGKGTTFKLAFPAVSNQK